VRAASIATSASRPQVGTATRRGAEMRVAGCARRSRRHGGLLWRVQRGGRPGVPGRYPTCSASGRTVCVRGQAACCARDNDFTNISLASERFASWRTVQIGHVGGGRVTAARLGPTTSISAPVRPFLSSRRGPACRGWAQGTARIIGFLRRREERSDSRGGKWRGWSAGWFR
jgi:hypothetical protein